MQLVAAGNRHDVVTRMITDIADVVTRRLLALAEKKYGPPPARYCWLACGSQGRQEQTGVSDQDNCLILEDDLSESDLAYFDPFAQFVSDGLDVMRLCLLSRRHDGDQSALAPIGVRLA